MKRLTLILAFFCLATFSWAQNLSSIATIPGLQPGSILVLSLQGVVAGSVWGTDIYTKDSNLASAAVHAGVLAQGAQGTVIVEVLEGAASYEGSKRGGVQSYSWGSYNQSFRFLKSMPDAAGKPQATKATPAATVGAKKIYVLKEKSNILMLRYPLGTSTYIRVRGDVSGRICGTTIYTADSSCDTAAVHAGLVAVGQTAIVKLTLRGPQTSFSGTTKNGVESSSYHSLYDFTYSLESCTVDAGSEVVEMIGAPFRADDLADATPGASFVIWLAGNKAGGSVWGSDIYTADSPLSAVAVHAGVLKDGEVGPVLLRIFPGQTSFLSTNRNGIQSKSYGSYPLCITLEALK